MKKKNRIISALVLILILLISILAVPVYAADKNTSNRFNVCFVLDSTNSLLSTDAEKLRYDATNMFLGLLANDGNNVGSVIFSGGVIKKTDVVSINGPSDKVTVEKNLETNEQLGSTTIGTALDQAIDMLIDKGDLNLPSVVILLSDGQSNRKDQDEMNSRSDALTKAKTKNIPVYTVALNADGEADCEVLEQMANATNGKYKEVKKADDLKDVFREFYNMIYSVGTIKIMDGVFPSNGKISVPFDVPYQGVEEVNIIISSDSKIENLGLVSPDGKKMSNDEVRDITTEAKRFSITKITNPIGGEWILEGKGKPGSNIKIDMIYNDSITVETEYTDKDKYGINDSVLVTGYILDDGEKLSSGYEDYTAKLVPDNDKGKEVSMRISENKFVGDITFDQEGTYTYHMEIEGNGLKKYTETASIKLNVGNFAPVVNDDAQNLNEHFWVFPFFTKTCEVDLSNVATDPDGDKLTFDVSSSTFKDTTYEINGDKLVIKDFYDLSKGICSIKASDPKGAFTEFDVTVSLTNVGIVVLVVLGIIILLFLAFIAFIVYYFAGRRLMGTVTVTNIQSGMKEDQTWGRGTKKMSIFHVGDIGSLKKAHILATGKPFIYVYSFKKYTSDHTFKASRKFKVNSNDEISIFYDKDRTQGIKIKFNSFAVTKY